MNLNFNEERGILWWVGVYRLFSSLIASSTLGSSQRSIESEVPAVTSTHFYHLVFTHFLIPSPEDGMSYATKLTKSDWHSASCSQSFSKAVSVWPCFAHHSGEKLLFFLSHCCRKTDLLRSHILWSIMCVSLEVVLGPVKSSIDATIIRVLRF